MTDRPPLMTIGIFSRASLLSVPALRRYHEQGLLVPAAVDPATGYRAYDPAQLLDAAVLRRLRGLDLPLADVARILEARDPEVTAEVLSAHRSRMEARLTEVGRIVAELDKAVRAPQTELPVHRRDEPHRHVLAVEGTVDMRDYGPFLDRAYRLLYETLGAGGFVPAAAPGALYEPELHDDEREPVVAYVPITVPAPVPSPFAADVTVRELPARSVAVVTHRGPYETIGDAYAALGRWIVTHSHPADDPVRELYLIGPAQTDDPHGYRTEICWPVTTSAP